MLRLGIAPRWGGNARSDWLPWLLRSLDRDRFHTVDVLAGGAPPRVETWVPALRSWLGDVPAALGRTVLVGHSVGCQAWVRALATLPAPVAGIVLVAPWFSVDRPWDAILPWQAPLPDWAAVRRNAGRVVAFHSQDDPFVAGYQANCALWKERIGGEGRMFAGVGHFNQPELPELLGAIHLAAAGR